MNENNTKCYNSLSCVLSVLIILFVVVSIGWDILVSKPEMRKSIEEIRIEVKDIHNKIDMQYSTQELSLDSIPEVLPADSIIAFNTLTED